MLLDRLGHRSLYYFGIGARINRGEGYLRRHNIWELRDRNCGNGDDAGKRNDDGYCQPKRLGGGFEVDDEPGVRRLLDWDVGGLSNLTYSITSSVRMSPQEKQT